MPRWYMAVLVRGSFVAGELDEERMGDLLYTLVEAPDAETAYARALELGRSAVDELAEKDGVPVTLRFLGLADLTEISGDRLGHGVEVYSQLLQQRPSEMICEKEELTVFEGALEEGPEDSGRAIEPR